MVKQLLVDMNIYITGLQVRLKTGTQVREGLHKKDFQGILFYYLGHMKC